MDRVGNVRRRLAAADTALKEAAASPALRDVSTVIRRRAIEAREEAEAAHDGLLRVVEASHAALKEWE